MLAQGTSWADAATQAFLQKSKILTIICQLEIATMSSKYHMPAAGASNEPSTSYPNCQYGPDKLVPDKLVRTSSFFLKDIIISPGLVDKLVWTSLGHYLEAFWTRTPGQACPDKLVDKLRGNYYDPQPEGGACPDKLVDKLRDHYYDPQEEEGGLTGQACR